jgi:hypothetical protein
VSKSSISGGHGWGWPWWYIELKCLKWHSDDSLASKMRELVAFLANKVDAIQEECILNNLLKDGVYLWPGWGGVWQHIPFKSQKIALRGHFDMEQWWNQWLFWPTRLLLCNENMYWIMYQQTRSICPLVREGDGHTFPFESQKSPLKNLWHGTMRQPVAFLLNKVDAI